MEPHPRAPATYHWQDWTLDELRAVKRASGTTVSLVVPARSEAATLGEVVGRVREALVDTVRLLDADLLLGPGVPLGERPSARSLAGVAG